MVEYIKLKEEEKQPKGKHIKLGKASIGIVEGNAQSPWEKKFFRFLDYTGAISFFIAAIVYFINIVNNNDFSNLKGLDLLMSKQLWLWFFDIALVCVVIDLATKLISKKD